MAEYYKANVRMRIHPDKLARFDEVSRAFKEQFASGKGVSEEVDEAYADVFSDVWGYSLEKAQEIKEQYLKAGGFRRVAAGAPRGDTQELLDKIRRIQCPTLIIYGYQDYEPITQAYILKERIQHARISFINRCGHFAWLEQPAEFYRIMNEFVHSLLVNEWQVTQNQDTCESPNHRIQTDARTSRR